jgi:hypothetical protein
MHKFLGTDKFISRKDVHVRHEDRRAQTYTKANLNSWQLLHSLHVWYAFFIYVLCTLIWGLQFWGTCDVVTKFQFTILRKSGISARALRTKPWNITHDFTQSSAYSYCCRTNTVARLFMSYCADSDGLDSCQWQYKCLRHGPSINCHRVELIHYWVRRSL